MRRCRPALWTTVACACALAPAGCGGAHNSTTRSGAIAQAERTHEYPSPPPRLETATGDATSPMQAVRRFAATYINWNAQTVAGRMRALAAQSVGQARSAMTLAAAQTADDYELRRGGISNRGTVEAVAPLSGHRHAYVVVTREATSATNTNVYEGLRPAWHLALATVLELPTGQWVLTGWQPEN